MTVEMVAIILITAVSSERFWHAALCSPSMPSDGRSTITQANTPFCGPRSGLYSDINYGEEDSNSTQYSDLTFIKLHNAPLQLLPEKERQTLSTQC